MYIMLTKINPCEINQNLAKFIRWKDIKKKTIKDKIYYSKDINKEVKLLIKYLLTGDANKR